MVDATQSLATQAPVTQPLATPRGDRLPVFNILGTTFRVFGRAPLLFLAFSVLGALPGLIRLAAIGAGSQTLTVSASIVAVFNMLLAYFVQAAMTYLAARVYEGGNATAQEALGVGFRRYLPVLAAMLLALLLAALGWILLLVPGIIVLCALAVTQPVCVLETLGPIVSLKRSRELTRGSRLRILGIYILFYVPPGVIGSVYYFLGIRAGHVVGGLIFNAIFSIAWAPILTICTTVIYLELRRLKEHVGVATVFD